MNPAKYLESRFVSSELRNAGKRVTPLMLAERSAVIAWLWIAVKIVAAFHFAAVLGHYLAVLVHLAPRPREAAQLVQAHQNDQAMKEASIRSVMEKLNASVKDNQEKAAGIGGTS